MKAATNILLVLGLMVTGFIVGYNARPLEQVFVEVVRATKSVVYQPVETIKEIPVEVIKTEFFPYRVERLVEVLVEVRVPFEIESEPMTSGELLARLEYQKGTHQKARWLMVTGQIPEGLPGLGTAADQQAIIDKYDQIIATVKWLINELGGYVPIPATVYDDDGGDDVVESPSTPNEPDWGKGGNPDNKGKGHK